MRGERVDSGLGAGTLADLAGLQEVELVDERPLELLEVVDLLDAGQLRLRIRDLLDAVYLQQVLRPRQLDRRHLLRRQPVPPPVLLNQGLLLGRRQLAQLVHQETALSDTLSTA